MPDETPDIFSGLRDKLAAEDATNATQDDRNAAQDARIQAQSDGIDALRQVIDAQAKTISELQKIVTEGNAPAPGVPPDDTTPPDPTPPHVPADPIIPDPATTPPTGTAPGDGTPPAETGPTDPAPTTTVGTDPAETGPTDPAPTTSPDVLPLIEMLDYIPYDDAVLVRFKAWHFPDGTRAPDYGAYVMGEAGVIKWAGPELFVALTDYNSGVDWAGNEKFPGLMPDYEIVSIRLNDITKPTQIGVIAVDRLGPYQDPDAATMEHHDADCLCQESINGQGNPANEPVAVARTENLTVSPRPLLFPGETLYHETFRDFQPLRDLPMPARDERGEYYGMADCYQERENDTLKIIDAGNSLEHSKFKVHMSHAETRNDNRKCGSFPDLNNNGSMVMLSKQAVPITDDAVVYSVEVDCVRHNELRFTEIAAKPAADILFQPGKLDGGGPTIPTSSGNSIKVKLNHDTVQLMQFVGGVQNVLVNGRDREHWDYKTPTANGWPRSIDKPHRLILSLSRTRAYIAELDADGKIFYEYDVPLAAPIDGDWQFYSTSQCYHLGREGGRDLVAFAANLETQTAQVFGAMSQDNQRLWRPLVQAAALSQNLADAYDFNSTFRQTFWLNHWDNIAAFRVSGWPDAAARQTWFDYSPVAFPAQETSNN